MTPAIVPGFWLHKIVGRSFRPFSWESRSNPLTWLQRWGRQAIPLIVGLILIGGLLIIMIGEEFEWQQIKNWSTLRPGLWHQMEHLVQVQPTLRFVVFVVSILFLCALGITITHARQTWILTEAVRRYIPMAHVTDHLLSGMAAPTEQCRVTIVHADARSFAATATRLAPDDLVAWLNQYVSRMCDIAGVHEGVLAQVGGDNLMVVFGLRAPHLGATNALACALDMIESLGELNRDLATSGLPQMNIGIGVHTGVAIAGEVGSKERRQYTILGPAVSIAYDLMHISKDLSEDLLPIVCSRETIRDTGLLADDQHTTSDLVEFSAKLAAEYDCNALFALRTDTRAQFREALVRIRHRRQLATEIPHGTT
jgi:class 3 adenylate cyclase